MALRLILVQKSKAKDLSAAFGLWCIEFPTTFYNGIPQRISVHPLSRYAPFKRWIFDEALVLKDGNPPFKNMKEVYEMTERGEQKRTPAELEKIAELKAKDEERRKLGLF